MASNAPNLAALPSPQSITLLLKNDMSTTLLSAEPSSTFDELKVVLLAALKSRNVSGLPESPTALDFAVLANPRDALKGWIPVHVKEQELAAGKTAKKGASGKKAALHGSLEGAGLGDGSWVAWRIKSSSVKTENELLDGDGDEMTLDIDDERDPGWNVKIPAYEDEEEQ